jgi:hypothetical protein
MAETVGGKWAKKETHTSTTRGKWRTWWCGVDEAERIARVYLLHSVWRKRIAVGGKRKKTMTMTARYAFVSTFALPPVCEMQRMRSLWVVLEPLSLSKELR